jgi:Flp pilus assembly pilin Flp
MSESFNALFVHTYLGMSSLAARLRREEGQTMVEYGIILAFIVAAVAAATVFTGLPQKIANAFGSASKGLTTPTVTTAP